MISFKRWNVIFFVMFFLVSGCFKRSEITVGILDELSGPTGELGQGSRNGIILATEEINAAGGINGRLINLHIVDVKESSEDLAHLADDIIEHDAIAILGCSKSVLATSLYQYTNEKQIVLISPTASSDQLSQQQDYFYRVQSTTAYDGNKLAEYIYLKGIVTLDCFYDLNNRSFTESFFLNFKEDFEAFGGEIRNIYQFHSHEQDLISEMNSRIILNDGPPDGYLMISSAIDTALLAQLISSKGLEADIFTTEWSSTEELLFKGGAFVEGLESISMYSPYYQTSKNDEFVSNYINRFGKEPSFAGALGYESMYLLAEGLKIAKDEKLELNQALNQISSFEGLTGTLLFDEYGDVQRPVLIIKVIDGQYQIIKEVETNRN